MATPNEPMRPHQLSPSQIQLLTVIYDAFKQLGDWPRFQYIDKLLDQQSIDAELQLRDLPDDLLIAGASRYFGAGDQVILTLAAVALTPTAEADLGAFVSVVVLATEIEHDFVPPASAQATLPQLTSDQVLDRTNGPLELVKRLYHLLQREPWFGGGSSTAEGWTVGISREIRKFRDVATIAEYLIRRSASFPMWPGSLRLSTPTEEPTLATIEASAPVPPVDVEPVVVSSRREPPTAVLLPQQRIVVTRSVAEQIGQNSWSEIDRFLSHYGLTGDATTLGRFPYAHSALSAATDAVLARACVDVGLSGLLSDWQSELWNPWAPSRFKLFCSHLSDNQTRVAEVAAAIEQFGVSGFVAHRDIEPQADWAQNIEYALESADALLAFVSPGFSSSFWCNQEVGWALGRRILTASIRVGADPSGFAGKFQAIPEIANADRQARAVFNLFSKDVRTAERALNGCVARLEETADFARANLLFAVLGACPFWSVANLSALEEAIQRNRNLQQAFAMPGAIDAIRRASRWEPVADVSAIIDAARRSVPASWPIQPTAPVDLSSHVSPSQPATDDRSAPIVDLVRELVINRVRSEGLRLLYDEYDQLANWLIFMERNRFSHPSTDIRERPADGRKVGLSLIMRDDTQNQLTGFGEIQRGPDGVDELRDIQNLIEALRVEIHERERFRDLRPY